MKRDADLGVVRLQKAMARLYLGPAMERDTSGDLGDLAQLVARAMGLAQGLLWVAPWAGAGGHLQGALIGQPPAGWPATDPVWAAGAGDPGGEPASDSGVQCRVRAAGDACPGGLDWQALGIALQVPVTGRNGRLLGRLWLLGGPAATPPDAARLALLPEIGRLLGRLLRNRRSQLGLVIEHEVFASGPVCALVWSSDDARELLYRSGNLSSVLGEQAAQALGGGTPFERLLHPDDRMTWRTVIRSHAETALQHMECSVRLVDPQGAVRWLRQRTVVRAVSGAAATGRRLICAYLIDETRQKQLEAQLLQSQDRLHLAMETAALGIADSRLDTGERLADARVAGFIGLRPQELEPTTSAWTERIHPYDLQTLHALQAQAGGDDAVQELQYRVRHRDGHYVWLQTHVRVVARGADGRPQRLIGTLKDVTRERRESELRDGQRQLLDLVTQAQGAFIVSRNMRDACSGLLAPLLSLTGSRWGFIGITRQAPDGHTYLVLPALSDVSWDAATREAMARHEAGIDDMAFHNLDNLFGRTVTHDTVVLANDPGRHAASRGHPQGHPRIDNFLGVPIRFSGQVVGMIGLANRLEGFDDDTVTLLEPLAGALGPLIHARDLDQARQRAEAELYRLATTDELTGLANRRHFMASAEAAIARAVAGRLPLSVALLDVDHFKRVNDVHGHAAGDLVLKHFADTVRRALGPDVLLGRTGGEEFSVLLPLMEPAAADARLEAVRAAVQTQPVTLPSGEVLRITVSGGVADWPPAASDDGAPTSQIDRALMLADQAMYAAKRQGRNRICRHAPGDAAPPA